MSAEREIVDSRSTLWGSSAGQSEKISSAVDKLETLRQSLQFCSSELNDEDVEVDRLELARYMIKLSHYINTEIITELVEANIVTVVSPNR